MNKYTYMKQIYAYLVREGKDAISDEEEQEGQKVVPQVYREDVALYLGGHDAG